MPEHNNVAEIIEAVKTFFRVWAVVCIVIFH